MKRKAVINLKTLETIERLFGIFRARHIQDRMLVTVINRKDKKLKSNSAAIWTILNCLDELFGKIFTNHRDVWE